MSTAQRSRDGVAAVLLSCKAQFRTTVPRDECGYIAVRVRNAQWCVCATAGRRQRRGPSTLFGWRTLTY